MRPDIVLYRGPRYEGVKQIYKGNKRADVLIVGGTSLVVYPAAGLVEYFRGDDLVLINKSSTPYDHRASLVINDSIGHVLKQATRDIL